MINATKYWKRDLIRWADELSRKKRQRVWNIRTNARIERCVFVGFYAVRKLLESRKLSQSVAGHRVKLVSFSRGTVSRGPVEFPVLHVHYDLAHGVTTASDLVFVCHQIVHSNVFSVAITAHVGLRGFYFASDFNRNSKLYFLDVDTAVRTFRAVGSDRSRAFDPSVIAYFDDVAVWTALPPAGLQDQSA